MTRDPNGPHATREAARRALRNRGIDVPEIVTTKAGEVRLSLPNGLELWDLDPDSSDYPAQLEHRETVDRVTRTNWAGAILDALRGAGVEVTPSREHLAHANEQYVVLALRCEAHPETPARCSLSGQSGG